MSEKTKARLRRSLGLLATVAALWAIYCIAVSLLFIWIFWVYVGLFAAGAILFVILVRGNVSPPPVSPPPGIDPTAYAEHRARILEYRRRYLPLLYISIGALISLLLDYINLMWFGGRFL